MLPVLGSRLFPQAPENDVFPVEEEAPASGVRGRLGEIPLNADSPDEVLAAAACAGSQRAAALIVKRHSARVRYKLHHWIGATDIDDHVQDVFIRLFEQLPRLRDRTALRGFLVGITLRIACSELRRRRRSRAHLTSTGDVPEPRPTTIDESEPAREALWRFEAILKRLSPSTRRVFVLRYVEKLELTDVAAEMSISVATAKRHLIRAVATVTAMAKREPALAEFLPTGSVTGDAPVFCATA